MRQRRPLKVVTVRASVYLGLRRPPSSIHPKGVLAPEVFLAELVCCYGSFLDFGSATLPNAPQCFQPFTASFAEVEGAK